MTGIGFGVHLLFDGYGCDESRLVDQHFIENLSADLPREVAMHPICDAVVVQVGANNRKDPGGLRGFVLVAESHVSIHAFPKRGFLSADVYTCQDDLDSDKLVLALTGTFGATSFESSVQGRGINCPNFDIYA